MNELKMDTVAEITELQKNIELYGQSIKDLGIQALKNARRIGQLLCEKQDELQKCHSVTFAEWVEENLPFERRTAYRYIDLFKYRFQLVDSSSIADSYKRIEEIKAIEHKTETEKANARVEECIKTGIKPEGWRRGTDDQLMADKIAYKEQVAQAEKDRKKRIDEFKDEWAEKMEMRNKAKSIFDDMTEEVFKSAEALVKGQSKRQAEMEEWKSTLRLSGDLISDSFANAMLEWLAEMESDEKRLSACHDIIKICKKLISDLQVKSVSIDQEE